MKNKKLAICLIVFACLVSLVILTSAIFGLSSATVNFLENPTVLVDNEEQIIDSAKFSYGSNVLFVSKNNYIKNIEKSNPYIKVLNIETIFPNKYCINCIERTEVFAVKEKDNKYLIIDEEFKVLNKCDVFLNNENNAILLSNVEIQNNYDEGDFVQFDERQAKLINQTFKSFREWNLSYTFIKQNVESVQIDYDRQNQVAVKMKSGVLIIVKDANEYNSDKFNLAFSTYDSDVKYQSQGILEVRLLQDNTLRIFWTAE